MATSLSRRQLIQTGLLTAAGTLLPRQASATLLRKDVDGQKGWQDFKIGVASYTFRKMSLEETIKAVKRLNLFYVSIKDSHLALTSTTDERAAAMQKLKDAGITPLSCGNITMQNDEADVRRAFDYAKDCAMPTIVCSPRPDSMPLVDKMVKEYDIRLAIHNHGPEDGRFPSPYTVYDAVKGYDQRIGLCIDVGHTAHAKVNPAEAIVKLKDRLYELHFKDISSTEPNGQTIEAGRGVLDLTAVVKSPQKIKYPHWVSIEFEGWEAAPLPAVAETLGYAKGLMGKGKRLR